MLRTGLCIPSSRRSSLLSSLARRHTRSDPHERHASNLGPHFLPLLSSSNARRMTRHTLAAVLLAHRHVPQQQPPVEGGHQREARCAAAHQQRKERVECARVVDAAPQFLQQPEQTADCERACAAAQQRQEEEEETMIALTDCEEKKEAVSNSV